MELKYITDTTASKFPLELGLYYSNDTNSGNPTYYYRGSVNNNFVSFAGRLWRIVRINEDGSIRMILNSSIGGYPHIDNQKSNNYKYLYYSYEFNNIRSVLEEWYDDKLLDYDKYIIEGDYCEAMKVTRTKTTVDNWSFYNATPVYYEDYIPNFKCEDDGNGHGIFNTKIGLITYDEALFAGISTTKGIPFYNGIQWGWTMTPSGYSTTSSWHTYKFWEFVIRSEVYFSMTDATAESVEDVRPVINLSKDTLVSGTGVAGNYYTVKNVSSVSIEIDGNGVVTVDNVTAYEGQTVNLNIVPNKGYQLKEISVVDSNDNKVDVVNNSFVMPNSDVIIKVEYEAIKYKFIEGLNQKYANRDMRFKLDGEYCFI